MSLPVALQLYSVRDDAKKDLAATLKAVKEMGYDGVEFASMFGLSADYIKGLLDGIGLEAVSAHVPYVDMVKDPKGVLGQYAQIGCKYVAIPYLTEEYRPGEEKFEEVIANAKIIGEVANSYGMKLLYHNHDFEFVKIDGKYALDILYDEVSADLLETEIDTCWVNVGGEDPAGYVIKYTGRAPVVHLKDFYISGKKPKHMYALIGIDDEDDGTEEESTFEFRPVGHGLQNIPAILDASVDEGAKWVVVEQDAPSQGLTPMESVKLSRDYLKTLGW